MLVRCAARGGVGREDVVTRAQVAARGGAVELGMELDAADRVAAANAWAPLLRLRARTVQPAAGWPDRPRRGG